jgi:hypothetical protein
MEQVCLERLRKNEEPNGFFMSALKAIRCLFSNCFFLDHSDSRIRHWVEQAFMPAATCQ